MRRASTPTANDCSATRTSSGADRAAHDQAYAHALRAGIRSRSRRADERRAPVRRARHTTHYSIVDREGNAVAITYTLNGGLRQRPRRRRRRVPAQQRDGRLQRQTRHAEPVRAARGRCQRDPAGQAHAVLDDAHHPARSEGRFRSWSAPRRLDDHHRRVAGLVDVVDYGMTTQQAVAAPRFHHQACRRTSSRMTANFLQPRSMPCGNAATGSNNDWPWGMCR